MSKLFHATYREQNKCRYCLNAKDWFRSSCYCIKYGIIITYGKSRCKGYEQAIKVKEGEG